jgi:hypothetical protein
MHKGDFSAIFWLNGSTKSQMEQSIAAIVRRLPQEQLSETSQNFSHGLSADFKVVIKEVLTWLSRTANKKWLLIFDNVDRDYSAEPQDVDAFDPETYFPAADHGSILITTRLSWLERLGHSHRLSKMTDDQGKSVLELSAGKTLPGKVTS